MKSSRREVSIDKVIHRGIFENTGNRITFFPRSHLKQGLVCTVQKASCNSMNIVT